jgi:hypothetical protein
MARFSHVTLSIAKGLAAGRRDSSIVALWAHSLTPSRSGVPSGE